MGTFSNTFGEFNAGQRDFFLDPSSYSDLNFWVKSRSGLTLIDDYGNNATILVPYLYKPTGNEYAYIADNTSLDIKNSDFTIAMWVKGEVSTVSGSRYWLGGKNITNSINGRYGFLAVAAGNYQCVVQSSSTTVNINSTVLLTDQQWHFLLMDVNQTSKIVRFFIDNVQISTDQSYLGTFASLGNQFEFYIGAGNNADGSTVDSISQASHSDTYLFEKLLTLQERTDLFNRSYVSGVKAHWPLNSWNINDVSGNGYHLTGVNLSYLKIRYSSFGSRHLLDKGYSLYQKINDFDIQVGYSDSGNVLISPTVPNGYTKTIDILGDYVYHNLADSKIRFIGDNWQRNNTTIFNSNTRLSFAIIPGNRFGYYDSINVGDWHISEINKTTMNSFYNTNYKGLTFPKITNNSLTERQKLTEIVGYSINKTGSHLSNILNYTNDKNLTCDIVYSFSDLHICTKRGSKYLAYDGSNTLSLSNDYGVTYQISMAITGITNITFAHIFTNGNIIFCSHTKAYISTDNLQSYNESTVLDINGDIFVPETYSNFFSIGYDFVNINGNEILVWGNYSTEYEYLDGTYPPNLNIWYSVDNGVTIKSAYKWGVSLPIQTARHVHGVHFNTTDNSFWVETGDYGTELGWMKGTYNLGTDEWSWNSYITNAWTKSVGFVFFNDYVYWASDVTIDSTHYGIWRVPYVNIADTTKYERVYYDNDNQVIVGFVGINETGEMIAFQQGSSSTDKRIIVSVDGINFSLKNLSGGSPFSGYNYFISPTPNESEGEYYRVDFHENTEQHRDVTKGQVLLIKVTRQ